jgi:predicted membrane protein
MPILIDKILTALILPINIALLLNLVAVVLLSIRRRRAAGVMLILSLTLLWVFSTPLMASS